MRKTVISNIEKKGQMEAGCRPNFPGGRDYDK